ncbi:MAG: hypothetical protein JO202_15505 [Ktedonobacteraceae bacterium]|nr:hypothetical protein [Ktedonobacteraceae bacterium]
MNITQLLQTLTPIVEVLERLNVPYHIGGSVDQDSLRSLRQQPLVKGGREFVLASPENTVVNKLEWYRIGGEVSNRQWNDLIGVLKKQGTALDLAYLERWAAALGVTDLLERALIEAGLRQP